MSDATATPDTVEDPAIAAQAAERAAAEERILAAIRDTIAEEAAARDGVRTVMDRRLDLFEEARALVPPITNKRIGEVLGITDAAVVQAIRARREARDAPAR